MRPGFRRDNLILWPAIGSQLVVTTGLFIAPVVITVLLGSAGFGEESAGTILSIEMVASAATTLTVSAWSLPVSARLVALAGTLLCLAGNLLSLVTPDFLPLAFARVIAGIGAGIVAAEVSKVVARARNRETLFSLMTIAGIVNGSVWLAVIPQLAGILGYRGAYLCVAIAVLIGAVLLWRLPAPRAAATLSMRAGSPGARGLPAVLILAATLATQLGQGTFWTLVGVYGANAGLSDETVGLFLSVATLLLLLGVIGTAWAGSRFGLFLPITVLIVLNALSIAVIAMVPDAFAYVTANILQSVTNLSSVVLLLSLAAGMDRSGRLVAASSGLITLGNGIGPYVAGSIAAAWGAPSAGPFVLGLNVIALLALTATAATPAGRTVRMPEAAIAR